MFNLIVSGTIGNGRTGSISADRVFEYTDKELISQYQPNGKLDISALLALPTIFMEEGISDQTARVGWLSRVELRGREYQLHYGIDHDIPILTNSKIHALSSDLKIEGFEFSRNHWAVKDVDLFHVLYREQTSKQPKPTVFQLSKNPVKPNLISMMMPFSGNFNRVYQTVKALVESQGYICKRADDFWLHSHIMHDVIELICTSSVVICDLSGKNPNVFYEAGIAHSLGKEVILITQHMDDVPFDLRSLRCITYLNNQEGCDQLAKNIADRISSIS